MWIFLVNNGYVFDVSACGDTCESAGKLCGMLLGTTMFKDKDLCIVRFPETFGSAVTAVILVTCEPTVIASIDNKSQISNTVHLLASIAWFVGGKSCYVLGKTTLNLHCNKLFTRAVTTTCLGNVRVRHLNPQKKATVVPTALHVFSESVSSGLLNTALPVQMSKAFSLPSFFDNVSEGSTIDSLFSTLSSAPPTARVLYTVLDGALLFVVDSVFAPKTRRQWMTKSFEGSIIKVKNPLLYSIVGGNFGNGTSAEASKRIEAFLDDPGTVRISMAGNHLAPTREKQMTLQAALDLSSSTCNPGAVMLATLVEGSRYRFVLFVVGADYSNLPDQWSVEGLHRVWTKQLAQSSAAEHYVKFVTNPRRTAVYCTAANFQAAKQCQMKKIALDIVMLVLLACGKSCQKTPALPLSCTSTILSFYIFKRVKPRRYAR